MTLTTTPKVTSRFSTLISNDVLRQIDSYSLPDAHDALKSVCKKTHSALEHTSCPWWYRQARAAAVEWVCRLPEAIRMHPTFKLGYVSRYERDLFGLSDTDSASAASLSSVVAVALSYGGCSTVGYNAQGTQQGGMGSSSKSVGRLFKDGDSLRILIHLLCVNPDNCSQRPAPLLPAEDNGNEAKQQQQQQRYTLNTNLYQGGTSTTYQMTGVADSAPLFPGMDAYGKRERIVVNWGCNLPNGVVPTTGSALSQQRKPAANKNPLPRPSVSYSTGSIVGVEDEERGTQSEGTLSLGACSMSRSLVQPPAHSSTLGAEANVSMEDAQSTHRPNVLPTAISGRKPGDGPGEPAIMGHGASIFTPTPAPEVEWAMRWQSSVVSSANEAVRMFGVGLVSPPDSAGSNTDAQSTLEGANKEKKHFVVCFAVGAMSIDPALSAARGLCHTSIYLCVPAGWGGPPSASPCDTYWHLDLSPSESLQLLHPAHIENQTEMPIGSHPQVLQHLRYLPTPYTSPVSMRDPKQVDVGVRLPNGLFHALVGFGACGDGLGIVGSPIAALRSSQFSSPFSPNTITSTPTDGVAASRSTSKGTSTTPSRARKAHINKKGKSHFRQSNEGRGLFASEEDSGSCPSSITSEGEGSISEGSLDGDLYGARCDQQTASFPATVSDLLEKCFLEPISEAVLHLDKDIVAITEIIVDLTTPKGIWKCSTGTGSVAVVNPVEMWAKRREQLGAWGRRYLQRVLADLVVNGGFPANMAATHMPPNY